MRHQINRTTPILVAILIGSWSVACASQPPTIVIPTATVPPTVTATPIPTTPTPAPSPAPTDVQLFGYDSRIPLDVKEITTKDQDGVTVRSITFVAHKPDYGINGRILAYIVTPLGKGPFAGMLFMHWLGQPRGNRDEFLDEAVALASRGTVSLLIQGIFPWTEAPSTPQHDQGQVIDQVITLRRALDLLLSQPDVDAQRIGYVGHDYGAMYGAILAGVDKRIKSYVLMTGMGTFSDWSLKYFAGPRAQDPDAYRKALAVVDPINFVGHAAPASLFFQFAQNDSFISEQVAQQFYNAASEPKQVRTYGAMHSLDDETARRDRGDWLAQELHLSRTP